MKPFAIPVVLCSLILCGGLLAFAPVSLAQEKAAPAAAAPDKADGPAGITLWQRGKEKSPKEGKAQLDARSKNRTAMHEKFRAMSQKRRAEMQARMKARREEMKKRLPRPAPLAAPTPPTPPAPEHPEPHAHDR